MSTTYQALPFAVRSGDRVYDHLGNLRTVSHRCAWSSYRAVTSVNFEYLGMRFPDSTRVLTGQVPGPSAAAGWWNIGSGWIDVDRATYDRIKEADERLVARHPGMTLVQVRTVETVDA